MFLNSLEQKISKTILGSILGIGVLGSGCAGMERGGWILSGPKSPSSMDSPLYSSGRTSSNEQPVLVDYVYYEPSSNSSDMSLLSFILSMTSFGAAQQGFIPQAVIMDAGSAAAGRQAIIEGQKGAVQQGRSLYWPGSKPGFLITQSKQFGVIWTVAFTGFADNGDGRPQIEEFLGTSYSFQSSREFEVGCFVENPMICVHSKVINEKNEIVLTSVEGNTYLVAAHIDAGMLKPGAYFAVFYGQVPYVKPAWHNGPPRGIVGRDYILGNIQFEVTP